MILEAAKPRTTPATMAPNMRAPGLLRRSAPVGVADVDEGDDGGADDGEDLGDVDAPVDAA